MELLDTGHKYVPDGQLESRHSMVHTLDKSKHNRLLMNGIYFCHLLKWLKYFPLERFHFVNGKDLRERPWVELKKVEQFLGIHNELGADRFERDPVKGFFHLKGFKDMGKTKGRAHPNMPQHIIDTLREYYEPFNQMFFDKIREDFGWSRNASG